MKKFEFVGHGSALRYGSERHLQNSAVIVLSGHVYHMVVDVNPSAIQVCKRCALQNLCLQDGKEDLLQGLCKECTPRGAGYWVEDRYPVQYTLEKICGNHNQHGFISQYACRIFDKPMFVGFDYET